MSFSSVVSGIFHGIETGAQAAGKVAPLAAMIPGIGGPVSTIMTAVAAVDTLAVPGATKKAAVTAVVASVHPTINATSISAAIDDTVAYLNALEKDFGMVTPAKT